MQIKTLWITRKYSDSPELLVAQDEYGMDENPEWFNEQAERELGSVGDDLAAARVIMLEVNEEAIERAFAVPVVRADVSGSSQI